MSDDDLFSDISDSETDTATGSNAALAPIFQPRKSGRPAAPYRPSVESNFTFSHDRQTAICNLNLAGSSTKLCGKKVGSASNLTNLRSHLKSHHKDTYGTLNCESRKRNKKTKTEVCINCITDYFTNEYHLYYY